MNRREFLIRIGGTLVAVPVVLEAVSCGSSNPAAPAHVDQFVVTSSVAVGHTHNVTITCAEISAAVEVPLDTTFNGHVHTVTLSNANFLTIASGGSAIVSSSLVDGHTHEFTFHKPANAC